MAAKTIVTAWFSDNADARGQYLQQADQIFRNYGMTNATVFGADSALVGDLTPHAVVMIDWEDVDQCQACFASAEYEAIIPLREQGFTRVDITLLGEQG